MRRTPVSSGRLREAHRERTQNGGAKEGERHGLLARKQSEAPKITAACDGGKEQAVVCEGRSSKGGCGRLCNENGKKRSVRVFA